MIALFRCLEQTQCYQLLNSLLRGQMNRDCTDEINYSLYQILDEFKKVLNQ